MRNAASPGPAADGSTRLLVLGMTLGALFAFGGPAAPELQAQTECEDVSGVWTVDVGFANAPQQVTITLEQTDCEITGLVKGNNENPIENGVVEGAGFTFDTTVTDGTGQSVVIGWQGTVDGDSVSGSLTAQMTSIAEFTGTRGEPEPISLR